MKKKVIDVLSYVTGISAILFLVTALAVPGLAAIGHPVNFDRETLPWFIPGIVGFVLMFPSAIIRNGLRRSQVDETFGKLKEFFPGGIAEEFKEIIPSDSPMAGPFEGLVGWKIWNLGRSGMVFKLRLSDGSGDLALYRRQEVSQKKYRLGTTQYASTPMTDFTVVNEREAEASGSGNLGIPNPMEYQSAIFGKPPRFPDSVTLGQEKAKEMLGDWQAFVDGLDCTDGYRQLLLVPQVRDAIRQVFGKPCAGLGIVIGRALVRIYHLEPTWTGKAASAEDCRMYLRAALDIAREKDAILERLGGSALDVELSEGDTLEGRAEEPPLPTSDEGIYDDVDGAKIRDGFSLPDRIGRVR